MLFTRLSKALSTPLRPICHKYSTAAAALSPPIHIESPTEPSIEPPAKRKHLDLESYLSNTPNSRTDTVYQGTKYEYTVQSALVRLGFDLSHSGGANDHGIDLLGTWVLPEASTQLKVLIQCKSQARRVSPSVIRELEGVFVGAPMEWRGPGGVIAMLASRQPATKGVREAMGRSWWPMGFVCCDTDGRVLQMLWNRRAEEEGLVGVGVCVRYSGEDEEVKVVNLTWKGEPPIEDKPPQEE